MAQNGIIVCGLIIVLEAAGSVQGQIVFARDIVHPSTTHIAMAKMDSYGVGQVDVICDNSIGVAPKCSTWLNGSIVIQGDEDLGLPLEMAGIMGISRDRDVLRTGAHSRGNLCEYTRATDGSWTISDTGCKFASSSASASYDVDPCTGLGGFLFQEEGSKDIIYVHETAQDVWKKMVLDTSSGEHDYGASCDLVYSATGNPIGVYRLFLPDPNGNTERDRCEVRAGRISGPGPLNTVLRQRSYPHQPQDVAIAPDGTIYMLDTLPMAADMGEARVYVSEDGGKTWSSDPNGRCRGVLYSGHIGTGLIFDGAIAVAPDESLVATLLLAGDKWRLFTSWDGGTTWDGQILPGGSVNERVGSQKELKGIWDLTIDAGGDLYVVYPGESDDSLHMLSTVPEPGTMSLLALVCALAWRRERA